MVAKEKNKWLLILFCVIISLIIILSIIWFFTNNTKVHNSTSTASNIKTLSLICKSTNPKDPFFEDSVAINEQHEIRILFNDDKLNKIFYIYSATYNSKEQTDYYNSIMAANYNRYLSNHNISPNLLSKTFSTSDNKSKITIYGNLDGINSATASIFLLDTNNNYNKDNNTSADIKNLYEHQGFTCEIN